VRKGEKSVDRMTLLSLALVSFPETVLVAALGLVLAEVRPRWWELAAMGAFQAGTSYLVRLSPIPFGAHTLLLAGLLVLAIRLVTRVEWRVAAVAGLLGLTIYGAIETVTMPVLLYFTEYSLTQVLPHPYLRILFFLPEAALLGLLTWLCLRFDFRLLGPPPASGLGDEDWQGLNRSYFLVYLLAILPVFLLVTLNIAFFASRVGTFPDRYLAAFLAFMSLAVLVLTALTPLKIQAIGRAVAEAHAARKTAESLRHIGRLLKLIRQQHHDFHHHLQTVYGLLEVGCHAEAREYIRKTFQTVAVPAELVRTDHPHVTALLYTKLALAEARETRLEPRVNCSLQLLPLSPLEACALLGNLLDNALEATAQAPPERRVVRLEIDRDTHGYVITVANPGRVPASRPSKLFRPGYTTKPGHAGLGLAGVRETALRYGGTVAVLEEGSETVFRVRLPLAAGAARGFRFPPGEEGEMLGSAAGEWEV